MSDTASGTDPILGSGLPGTFPTRGEVSAWEGSFAACDGAILGLGSLRDQSAQVSSQTVEGEQEVYRSDTASGTDPILGSRHQGTFPTRGQVSAREGSDCQNK